MERLVFEASSGEQVELNFDDGVVDVTYSHPSNSIDSTSVKWFYKDLVRKTKEIWNKAQGTLTKEYNSIGVVNSS